MWAQALGGSNPSSRTLKVSLMHSKATITEALRLRDEEGLGARGVARILGLPVATVRDWHAGKLPMHSRPDAGPVCPQCGQAEHRFSDVGRDYVYLLGLYLGDGTLSEHRRSVFKLRITLDVKYPGIVDECADAMASTIPHSAVARVLKPSNCFEVYSYSRSWACFIPQHGPGKKHLRRIWLAGWQQRLAERWPEALIRGMFQSDGSRFINTGRGGWRHPRYEFSNRSTDITSIFCTACDCLDLRWTASFPKDESRTVKIYVSRKADVARMDEFVGPKA
jgi:hypothetical protein